MDIHHKEILSVLLKSLRTKLSEYTFANLYLFRKSHTYEVVSDKEDLFIKGKSYDGYNYLMPTRDVRQLDITHIEAMMREVDFLFPVPEEWLPVFDPDRFEIMFSEGDQDYVYTVEKMSTYKGRHLHKKRNLLKQFLEAYQHDARPLTSDRLDHARYILNDWLATSGSKPEETDYGPCLEALNRYEEIVLCGGIYYADNEPAGFVLGEELNSETFVLHFAKARTRFTMFNNFAAILPPRYKYLNLEQDLEKENLRVFKSSYVPDALLKKARVRLLRK